jgi:hypothetical protein
MRRALVVVVEVKFLITILDRISGETSKDPESEKPCSKVSSAAKFGTRELLEKAALLFGGYG